MPSVRQFPTRGVLRRPQFSPIDVGVFVAVVVLLVGIVRLAHAMNANAATAHITTISTSAGQLPYYAARSLLRMFIALFLSVTFTFIYATAAARSRRARIVLIPVLDILQSVPILGFLTITITFFIALFPGSVLGLECASIFAIFTSQAWNMTFSMYHSLITQPAELDEAARMFRLTKWQRFWHLDVPSSMIGLVWNMMMSMGGGWFFLTASEAVTVTVNGKPITESLPGIGSYMGAAAAEGSYPKVGIAIVTMIILVVGTNFFVFRPLVAWSDRFRMETSESTEKPKSIVLNALRRSSIPHALGRLTRPIGQFLDRATRRFGLAEYPLHEDSRRRRWGDFIFWGVIAAAAAFVVIDVVTYLNANLGFSHLPAIVAMGATTFGRVVVLLIVSTLIWVPIGVKIGMNPKFSRYAQPVVQVLASFPAILLFPFVTAIFIALGIPLDIGAILLMALGAQWYILFNVIAGASAIPNDMVEMMRMLRLNRRQRWRQVILPAVFPAYVTGGVTAAGGAWNASIVAELVAWHRQTLNAYGLGNYISTASSNGKFALIIAGGIVMSAFVVTVNRLFWRRLYRLAETRFAL
jgi:NitT/TauT family transport system permease protein